MKATVIGAGLAGCEAAWQLAEHGIEVRLYEMRPGKMTPPMKLINWQSWYAVTR